jgi:hypothetical protein
MVVVKKAACVDQADKARPNFSALSVKPVAVINEKLVPTL